MAAKIREETKIFVQAPSDLGEPIDIHVPCRLRTPGWCREDSASYPSFMTELVEFLQAIAPDRSDECEVAKQKRAPLIVLPAPPGEALEVFFFFRLRGTSGARVTVWGGVRLRARGDRGARGASAVR